MTAIAAIAAARCAESAANDVVAALDTVGIEHVEKIKKGMTMHQMRKGTPPLVRGLLKQGRAGDALDCPREENV
jgi:Zn ribbon nucleic-acid-binding protein